MALAGRTPTKEEKAHMNRVAALGCIVCWTLWDIYSPCEIHHIDGKTKPGAHLNVLGLCPCHHRLPGKGYVSRADGKKPFEAAYGTEQELKEITAVMLEL